MTPGALLDVQWRYLAGGKGLSPWYVVVRPVGFDEPVELKPSELFDLLAAAELGRVSKPGVAGLLARRRVTRRSWTWDELMDGALGLRRSDARQGLTLGQACELAGIEIVSVDTLGGAR